ncbi:hypothetical protein CCACVL1_21605 [Corchorus capsularis]|uniref:Uncharacterized protein n=1 Tax=Corchorus capsularis TaxID=210143 RepID=A0A1R3H3E6_COCAP|nr:hypothetical protein CCACVL1_21605 [Corchorus capsularis]
MKNKEEPEAETKDCWKRGSGEEAKGKTGENKGYVGLCCHLSLWTLE